MLISLSALSGAVTLLVVSGHGKLLLGCNLACLAANAFAVSWAMQFGAHLLVRAPADSAARACVHVLTLSVRTGHRVHGAVQIFPAANGFSPGWRC